jgi:asparagine synthase (glutamine-hydrolysing)
MGPILAAFGPVETADWALLVKELGSGGNTLGRDWQGDEGAVRLAIATQVDPAGPLLAETADLTAVAAGRFDPPHCGSGCAGVLLDVYQRDGLRGISSLRGQYVFALWERRIRALMVGCDPVGLHAPAYVWDGRALLVSTRAVTLLRYRKLRPVWNGVYVAHALTGLWAQRASTTAFRGIRRLTSGEILCASARGLESLPGDRLAFQDRRSVSVDDAGRELAECMDHAVSVRLRDPHKDCISLSGGVDSSSVALALMRRWPGRELDAFSFVASAGTAGIGAWPLEVARALPRARWHWVDVSRIDDDGSEPIPIADDALASGPALQAARVHLLRMARSLGFERVFDGEGGDELFDIAWRPGDIVRELALGAVAGALRRSGPRRRLVRDLIVGGSIGPVSLSWLDRERRRLRARRPWLRTSLWQGRAFAVAWDEMLSFGAWRRAAERLPEILGAFARYWRIQELARLAVGIESASPLLDRRVIELVGSLPARVVTDPRCSKALLRRVVARGLPVAIAYRPKSEPLIDELLARVLSAEVSVVLPRIRNSALLSELIDPAEVVAAVSRAQRAGDAGMPLAAVLVQLFAVVNWVAQVEDCYGVG